MFKPSSLVKYLDLEWLDDRKYVCSTAQENAKAFSHVVSKRSQPSTIEHACNSNTWDEEAGEFQMLGKTELYRKTLSQKWRNKNFPLLHVLISRWDFRYDLTPFFWVCNGALAQSVVQWLQDQENHFCILVQCVSSSMRFPSLSFAPFLDTIISVSSVIYSYLWQLFVYSGVFFH